MSLEAYVTCRVKDSIIRNLWATSGEPIVLEIREHLRQKLSKSKYRFVMELLAGNTKYHVICYALDIPTQRKRFAQLPIDKYHVLYVQDKIPIMEQGTIPKLVKAGKVFNETMFYLNSIAIC